MEWYGWLGDGVIEVVVGGRREKERKRERERGREGEREKGWELFGGV